MKGGDSLLYHAIKLYKLAPELHWTAGGYIWPIDSTVEISIDASDNSAALTFSGARRAVPAIRGPFTYGNPEEEETDNLRARVENSGAVSLAEADITILTSDWQGAVPPISKERVPFVSNGELEKLVVNVLLVTYVA